MRSKVGSKYEPQILPIRRTEAFVRPVLLNRGSDRQSDGTDDESEQFSLEERRTDRALGAMQ